MSVVDIDFENVLTTLADTFRKDCFKHIKSNGIESVQEGICVRFSMSYANYSDDGDFQTNRHQDFVVIFTGNTSVFVGTDFDDIFRWNQEVDKFRNTSNHDSCWRSDGLNFLTDTYFGMASSINEERKQAGLSELAPRDLSCHTRFNFSDSVGRVRIRKKKQEDSYHYDLLEIKRLPLFGE